MNVYDLHLGHPYTTDTNKIIEIVQQNCCMRNRVVYKLAIIKNKVFNRLHETKYQDFSLLSTRNFGYIFVPTSSKILPWITQKSNANS